MTEIYIDEQGTSHLILENVSSMIIVELSIDLLDEEYQAQEISDWIKSLDKLY